MSRRDYLRRPGWRAGWAFAVAGLLLLSPRGGALGAEESAPEPKAEAPSPRAAARPHRDRATAPREPARAWWQQDERRAPSARGPKVSPDARRGHRRPMAYRRGAWMGPGFGPGRGIGRGCPRAYGPGPWMGRERGPAFGPGMARGRGMAYGPGPWMGRGRGPAFATPWKRGGRDMTRESTPEGPRRELGKTRPGTKSGRGPAAGPRAMRGRDGADGPARRARPERPRSADASEPPQA